MSDRSPTVPSYCPGWLDPRSIEGPFTRIAPLDFSKITFLGRVYYFDTAQMGWEFYYHAAKEQAKYHATKEKTET